MNDFALVTEGVTDHAIIKNILVGFYKGQREPEVKREFPDPLAEMHYGGWTLVLQYLRDKKFEQTFQLCRFLIIQIDTDIADHLGFDVPRNTIEGPVPLEVYLQNVIVRLIEEIGEESFAQYNDRFIFAIGVEQLECWLLPLWFNGAQAEQTANCTSRVGSCPQLRNTLNAKNYKWITAERKEFLSYDMASREFRKPHELLKNSQKNLGLALFLEELTRRNITLEPLE